VGGFRSDMMRYRSDIDGLRAIAVLAVVLFHARVPYFSGGFVGVDVFFVISGFLITGIIASEGERFSLTRFYVRRARRILPALFVVVIASVLMGLVILTPYELKNMAQSGLWVAGFLSNIFFMLHSDYFSHGAEAQPFLHAWTLSVEEQFYIVWPTVFVLLSRFRNRMPVIVGLAVLSFALSVVAMIYFPPGGFYSAPSRAWELLIGGVLALGWIKPLEDARIRTLLAASGVAMIFAACAFYGPRTVFPGWSALLPCGGAALVIYSGIGKQTPIHSALSTKPMVFVGLISYSLYLWHWPLLAFARIANTQPLGNLQIAAVIAAAFVCSSLSWKFVETPLRHQSGMPNRIILVRYGAACLAFAALMLGIIKAQGFPARVNPDILLVDAASQDIASSRASCTQPISAMRRNRLKTPCVFNGDRYPVKVAVWGDSISDANIPGLVTYFASRKIAVTEMEMNACLPLPNVEMVSDAKRTENYDVCIKHGERTLASILASREIEIVVLSAAWSGYVAAANDAPKSKQQIAEKGSSYLRLRGTKEATAATTVAAFREGLDRLISRLEAAGKRVVILGEVPMADVEVPDCLARAGMFHRPQHSCDVPQNDAMLRYEPRNKVFREVMARHPSVCFFDPAPLLCANGWCAVAKENHILYLDRSHLTVSGAEYLARHYNIDRCVTARR
jgi:peptidoglycan/LPS O-acetylase OafA/YrhL